MKVSARRVSSFLMAVMMAISLLPIPVLAEDTESDPVTSTQVELVKGERLELDATIPEDFEGKTQWQIYNSDADYWVSIRGEKNPVITVSYPMIASMLYEDSVKLRCIDANNKEYVFYESEVELKEGDLVPPDPEEFEIIDEPTSDYIDDEPAFGEEIDLDENEMSEDNADSEQQEGVTDPDTVTGAENSADGNVSGESEILVVEETEPMVEDGTSDTDTGSDESISENTTDKSTQVVDENVQPEQQEVNIVEEQESEESVSEQPANPILEIISDFVSEGIHQMIDTGIETINTDLNTANEDEEGSDSDTVVIDESPSPKDDGIDENSLFVNGDNQAMTYNIVINYLYTDNRIVTNPYVVTIAAGEDYHERVDNPIITGYEPYVNAVAASYVDIDVTNIQKNVAINVSAE